MTRLTCNFQGRLGNCMFEVAAVIATAKRQGSTPCFQRDECDYYRGIPAFQAYLKPILRKFDHWTNEKEFSAHEDSLLCYKELPVFTRDTMLRGYFTSAKYFNDARQEIITLFSVNHDEVQKKVLGLRQRFPGRHLVAVHVRRTDYVSDYGWALPLDYYRHAAAIFPRSVFVVFSDEPDWCRSNLGFMADRVYAGEQDYIELQMMGQFDGIIIANSTFSTWGAMLGDPDSNKTVVAPAQWLPPGRGNHNSDIKEPHWILL